MKAKDIAEKLKAEAESVARYLLPAGRMEGPNWCVGDISGAEGKSLKVCTTGSKAGVWKDFAQGDGGDLLDLWMGVKGCTLPEAMNEACSYLGIVDHKPKVEPKKYKPPVKVKGMGPIATATPAMDYLMGRGLTAETLKLFKIYGDQTSVFFPFIHDGKAKMIKQLKIKRVDGKKDIRPTSKDQMPCLMGWQTVTPESREIVICEGEINAMSVKQSGHDALAVPFGAGGGSKQDWIENEYDRLERFDTIYLWFDNDKPGKEAVEAVVPRLGSERCRVIQNPRDANDQLIKGLDMAKLKANSKDLAPSAFARMGEFRDEVWAELNNPEAHAVGYRLPWKKCGTKFVFRAGEVTAFTGYNSHGKTVALSQMVVNIMTQGCKVCMASMESRPSKWASVMVKQYLKLINHPTPKDEVVFDDIWKWFHETMSTYAGAGRGKQKEILEVFSYARKRYGAEFFVIDNLSAVDVGMDDYDGQRDFVQTIVNFAKRENVHVVFVAHQRKPFNDNERGDRYGIKGSGSLSDLADNVILWWRNKAKEKERYSGSGNEHRDDPDAIMAVDKQRETGVEPEWKLWFHPESKTFCENPEIYAEGPSWDQFNDLQEV